MTYIIGVAWLVQAAVGIFLFLAWARHARGGSAGAVLAHTMLMVCYLVPWAVFIATGIVTWAWLAVVVLTIGIPFGDVLMVRRSRSLRGERSAGLRDYGAAVADVFAGRMPRRVAFHALFGAVVYFGSLGIALAATAAR